MKDWIKDELDSDDVKFTTWERVSLALATFGLVAGIAMVLSVDSEVMILQVIGVAVVAQVYCSVTNGVALSRIEKRLYILMRIMCERR